MGYSNAMPRIDGSHQPFKRTRKLGPGPKKRPAIGQTKDWECIKTRGQKTDYTQLCRYVGPDRDRRGEVRLVKTNKAKKKRYNKVYRAWAKKHRKALQAQPARPGYRCRSTVVSPCR